MVMFNLYSQIPFIVFVASLTCAFGVCIGVTVRVPQTTAYVVNSGLTLGSGGPQLTVHHRPPQVHSVSIIALPFLCPVCQRSATF